MRAFRRSLHINFQVADTFQAVKYHVVNVVIVFGSHSTPVHSCGLNENQHFANDVRSREE